MICGGIGEGAQAALTEQGIELFAGVSGQADEAVENYNKRGTYFYRCHL